MVNGGVSFSDSLLFQPGEQDNKMSAQKYVGIKDDKSVAKWFIQATFDLPQDDKGSEES